MLPPQSFIYGKNNESPSMLPWGTPDSTVIMSSLQTHTHNIFYMRLDSVECTCLSF